MSATFCFVYIFSRKCCSTRNKMKCKCYCFVYYLPWFPENHVTWPCISDKWSEKGNKNYFGSIAVYGKVRRFNVFNQNFMYRGSPIASIIHAVEKPHRKGDVIFYRINTIGYRSMALIYLKVIISGRKMQTAVHLLSAESNSSHDFFCSIHHRSCRRFWTKSVQEIRCIFLLCPFVATITISSFCVI